MNTLPKTLMSYDYDDDGSSALLAYLIFALVLVLAGLVWLLFPPLGQPTYQPSILRPPVASEVKPAQGVPEPAAARPSGKQPVSLPINRGLTGGSTSFEI